MGSTSVLYKPASKVGKVPAPLYGWLLSLLKIPILTVAGIGAQLPVQFSSLNKTNVILNVLVNGVLEIKSYLISPPVI
jgi:hypothetical protein